MRLDCDPTTPSPMRPSVGNLHASRLRSHHSQPLQALQAFRWHFACVSRLRPHHSQPLQTLRWHFACVSNAIPPFTAREVDEAPEWPFTVHSPSIHPPFTPTGPAADPSKTFRPISLQKAPGTANRVQKTSPTAYRVAMLLIPHEIQHKRPGTANQAQKTSQCAYTVAMLLLPHEIQHNGPGTANRQLTRRVNARTR